MQISKERLEEFKEIYFAKHGVRLSDSEALCEAWRVIRKIESIKVEKKDKT